MPHLLLPATLVRLRRRSSSLLGILSPFAVALYLACIAPLNAQNQNDAPDARRNPFAADPHATEAGKLLYEQTCQSCHGGDARGSRGPSLLGGFKHGASDTDIFQNIKTGIPGTQMPAFALLSSDSIWRIITYLHSLDTARDNAAENVSGDSAAGEKIFSGKGQCSSCHEVNGRGSVFASDLSAIGMNSAESLSASILHPGAQPLAPRPQSPAHEGANRGGGGGNFGSNTPVTEIVKTRGGEEIRGLRLADDGFALLLRLPDGSVKRFESADVLEKREGPKPLMPDNYAERLSSAELQDLVAYLKTLTERSLTKTAAADIPGGITPERMAHSTAEPQNWTSYWGNYAGSHFTSLDQITPANVQHLAPAWSVQMPGPVVLETTPVVIDGIMYVSGIPGQVFALDAKTGQQIWKWERRQKTENPYMTNPYNRGVAVMGNRVFVGTLDAVLIALDARTGLELWEAPVADTMLGYTITAAPLVVKDKVIVGVQVASSVFAAFSMPTT